MESVVHWFAENMPSFLTPEAAVFLISMVPILELRGGLLLATVLKIPMLQAVIACVIGISSLSRLFCSLSGRYLNG